MDRAILVTGAAGFIGSAVCEALLRQGYQVVGLDNLNAYYSVQLKQDRLERLKEHPSFHFELLDLVDLPGLSLIFQQHRFQKVIHLAAQAGVRYSLTHPEAYIQSNIVAFLNILECCRAIRVAHLVYASSSSVYGANKTFPFSETDRVDHPVSLYAATKKSNELMAHSYAHLYGVPSIGLRFFSVYGPWGRPDMAAFLFTRAIMEGQELSLFNGGEMWRDFTYIEDIVRVICSVTFALPVADPFSGALHRVYNVGHSTPVLVKKMVSLIEMALKKKAKIVALPMQAGDVGATHADIQALINDGHPAPTTSIEEGIPKFVHWFKNYYEKVSV